MESIDPTDIHGGLLALTEIGLAYQEAVQDPVTRDQHLRQVPISSLSQASCHLTRSTPTQIFGNLSRVSFDKIRAFRNHLVTAAACRLIASTLTIEEIDAGDATSVPNWRKIVDVGIRHRKEEVQDAAAAAMGTWSRLADCENEINK